MIRRKLRLKNSFKSLIKDLREPQLICIVGVEGSGKTSLLTACNVLDYKKNRKFREENFTKNLEMLHAYGYENMNYTDSYWHSNVRILLTKNRLSLFTTFDKFGLPTENNKVDNYPFYSLLSFDEPEGDIDSREFKTFDSTSQYGGLKLKRHKGLTLLFVVHNPNNIEKRVRENIRRIIFIYSRTSKPFLFFFKRTTWYTREYHASYGLDFLQKGFTGELPKESHLYRFVEWKRYTFWGNIYSHYDSEAFKPNWFVNEPFINRRHIAFPTYENLPEHRAMYGFGAQKNMFKEKQNEKTK